jgi:nucleoside-diphosphate-sugar epimerase
MYLAVTGSSGKLGRAAVSALRNAKHRVVGLGSVDFLCAI